MREAQCRTTLRAERAQGALSLQTPASLEQTAGLLVQDVKTAFEYIKAGLRRGRFAFARKHQSDQPGTPRESANPWDDAGETWDSFIGNGPHHRSTPTSNNIIKQGDKPTIDKFGPQKDNKQGK